MTLRRRAALALAALAALPSAPAVAQDAAAQLWRSAQIGVAVRAVWLDFACDAALTDALHAASAALDRAAVLLDGGADPQDR